MKDEDVTADELLQCDRFRFVKLFKPRDQEMTVDFVVKYNTTRRRQQARGILYVLGARGLTVAGVAQIAQENVEYLNRRREFAIDSGANFEVSRKDIWKYEEVAPHLLVA